MRATAVTISQLGIACWSARRFTGGCADCSRVKRCTLPEAVGGLVVLARRRLEKQEAKVEKCRQAAREATEELKKYEEAIHGPQA